jgi:hypothetical protein
MYVFGLLYTEFVGWHTLCRDVLLGAASLTVWRAGPGDFAFAGVPLVATAGDAVRIVIGVLLLVVTGFSSFGSGGAARRRG